MKCPQCIKEGKRSIVTEGLSCSFSEHVPNRWDEDGKLIVQDYLAVKSATEYSCSNGHTWNEETS